MKTSDQPSSELTPALPETHGSYEIATVLAIVSKKKSVNDNLVYHKACVFSVISKMP